MNISTLFFKNEKILRQDALGRKTEIVRCHQMVLHLPPDSFHRKAMAASVQVSVVADFYPILFQKCDDLRAGIALITGRIMQKTELGMLPRRLQRGLQPDQFPAEHLFIVARLVLLIKPPPCAAQGCLTIEMAIIVEKLQRMKAIL